VDLTLSFGILIVVLLATLALGVWVSLSIFLTACLGLALYTPAPVVKVVTTTVWGALANWSLTALPLFIWMGEILYRTRLAEGLFRALAPCVGRLYGGLLHVNVAGGALFAAVSGSSAATAATVGRLSIPELTRRGYDRRSAMGSLAASGTLGMLIPPSIVMIVYGVAAEVSIARLFIAGILPGIALAALFSAYIMLEDRLRPVAQRRREPRVPWREALRSLGGLAPVLFLMLLVIGSIYSGIATPTEAAAVGVVGALIIAACSRTLSLGRFLESLAAAARSSTMIIFIIAGASVLATMMGLSGMPAKLAAGIVAVRMSPAELIAILTLAFILLGCFLDGISIVLLSTALIMPAVSAAGIDPVWFGVYLVVVVEMSQITPPVGFNLFVVQGLTGEDILTVAKAALPYFFVMVLFVAILMLFPSLATFLPRQMLG